MCECCLRDSSNIFLGGNIVSISFFIRMVRHASSILCISFSCFYHAHCWCCFDSWVAVLPHPSPHINNPSRDVFMRGFRPLDNSNILSRILCCFRFLSNTWDMRSRSSEFRLHGFLSRMTVLIKSMGVAESYVRYKYNYEIILWEYRGLYF